MKFRKTKTVILTCLIFCSLILSVRVWFDEELWPGGYNFFIMLRNTPVISRIFNSESSYSMPKENLSKPQKVVITNGSERSVFYNSDTSFDAVNTIVKDFLTKTLLTGENVLSSSAVPKEEWYDVLRNDELLDTRSIYIDYSLAFTPSLFAHVIGIQNSWMEEDVTAVKEFIVAPVNSDSVDALFYVKDFGNGTIMKYFVSYDDKDVIDSAIRKYAGESDDTNSFSFELNLDNKSSGIGSGVVQKVFLDSMVIVSTNTSEKPVIESENPLANDGFSPNAMLGVFDYPSVSPRHYTDTSGTEYFVENYSVLKIYPEGIIEYTADRESMGIEISENLSLYESLNRAIEFSEKIWKAVVPEEPFNVLVTSNLIENSQDSGTYNFTLDYYYYGSPVTVEAGGMNHAVEISVKNGKIVSYRHFIRKYSPAEATAQPVPMIDALDRIYASFAATEEEIEIKDVYLSYIDNGGLLGKMPVWSAEIRGSEKVFYLKGE